MSYDDTQLAAVLTICAGCERSFYMTQPQKFCIRCRWTEAKVPLELGRKRGKLVGTIQRGNAVPSLTTSPAFMERG